jgi:hypothetical protein
MLSELPRNIIDLRELEVLDISYVLVYARQRGVNEADPIPVPTHINHPPALTCDPRHIPQLASRNQFLIGRTSGPSRTRLSQRQRLSHLVPRYTHTIKVRRRGYGRCPPEPQTNDAPRKQVDEFELATGLAGEPGITGSQRERLDRPMECYQLGSVSAAEESGRSP